MAEYNLSNMAVNMFCPGNVLQQDDAGLPSALVWIPAFKNSDVLTGGDDSIHPAFIVNGKQIPGFYYSKYQNIVYNGKAYSLPAENPTVEINFDNAIKYSEAKGYGWHMSTAAEWAAIALWCKKNGTMPSGNNDYGKDVNESEYNAIGVAVFDTGETSRVATGTGPLTWSHDRTPSGIWDMNGNCWELQAGVRVVWGELQILANNDAADPENPQNATSTRWKAINAADGSLVEPESKTTDTSVKASGSTVKFDYVDNVWMYTTGISAASDSDRGCHFGNIACADAIGTAAKALLTSLALLPNESSTSEEYGEDIVWINNGSTERIIARGGSGSYGGGAGVFSILGHMNRNASHQTYGFRSAYIPNISE